MGSAHSGRLSTGGRFASPSLSLPRRQTWPLNGIHLRAQSTGRAKLGAGATTRFPDLARERGAAISRGVENAALEAQTRCSAGGHECLPGGASCGESPAVACV